MRRPLLLLLLAVVVPAVVLAALGFRTVWEERRLVDTQIRSTLDRVADGAAADLQRALASWAHAAAAAETACRSGHPPAPSLLQQSEPGSAVEGVVVCIDGDEVRTSPPNAAAWAIGRPERDRPPQAIPPAYLDAETTEIVREDYRAAAGAYRALLSSSAGDRRAWLLHRLARTSVKAGDRQAALALYRELRGAEPTVLGGLPSDLVAGYAECDLLAAAGDSTASATCGARLYAQLVGGTWRLDKTRYLFYADAAERWAGAATEPAAGLSELRLRDSRRRGLALAIEAAVERISRAAAADGRSAFTAGSAPYPYLCFLAHQALTPGAGSGAIVSVAALTDSALRRQPPDPDGEGVSLTLAGPDGAAFFGALPATWDSATALTPPSVRSVQAADTVWQVRAAIGGRLPIVDQLERRRRISTVMLGLMLITLVFGIVVVGVTTARALDVARMKSQFVSAVSHEFRSPLTAVRQLAELLARGRVPTDERKQEYYDTILREIDRLGRLVENVLDFSRMEDKRKQYRVELFDTASWLRAAVQEFEPRIASLGMKVQASIASDLPATTGDREALTRAVHNLLDNAAKYSPGQPTVWLSAGLEGEELVIEVRDRGVGIPQHEQARVFDRFFRGAAMASSVSGTGLGLAIVKHAAEAHGGRVVVRSEAGKGTAFALRLPLGGPKGG